jgi:hypothetical protein
MASWQHLTDTSNLHVEVNMDLVCFMRQMPTSLRRGAGSSGKAIQQFDPQFVRPYPSGWRTLRCPPGGLRFGGCGIAPLNAWRIGPSL